MTADALLRIETDLGAIEVAVHADRAPTTAAYVRQLAEAGSFTDAAFYRSTTLGSPDRQPLIQGGPLAPAVVGSDRAAPNVAMLESIETIDDTGLRHQPGTVSLARDLNRTGHALPELFICLDDYPELDAGGRSEPDGRGFPAFGTIVIGIDVVAAIAARETKGTTPIELLRGQVLTDPVHILRATYTNPPSEAATDMSEPSATTNNSTRTVIRNGTVLDTTTMTYTENQTVVIEDGVIVELTDSYTGGSHVDIDAAGRFVLPGLIDGHFHFRLATLNFRALGHWSEVQFGINMARLASETVERGSAD